MRTEGRRMLCTINELSEWLASRIDPQDVLRNKFPDCDFSIIDISNEEEESLECIASGAMGWYGVKEVNAGFDSDSLMLISDYYGGGCASMCTFFDGFDHLYSGCNAIRDLLLETLSCCESANGETIVIVDVLGGKCDE